MVFAIAVRPVSLSGGGSGSDILRLASTGSNALLVFGESMPGCCQSPQLVYRDYCSVHGCGVSRRETLGRIALILPSCKFLGCGWLRGHVLTGLPWNLFGHAWSGPDALLNHLSLDLWTWLVGSLSAAARSVW